MATLASKGQITLPKEINEAQGCSITVTLDRAAGKSPEFTLLK